MLLLLLACRPDPGNPSYPDPAAEETGVVDTGDPNNYPGPDPYAEGEARLSVGAFYEGGYSDLLAVDVVSIFYYIYSNTFTQTVDSDERIEGYVSDLITVGGQGWWGGGIHSGSAVDLSAWTTVHFSAKSETIDDFDLGIQADGGEGSVQASSYGFVNDGEWHSMDIPLADFGLSTGTTTGLLLFIGEGDAEGSTIHFDNLYYTAE